MVQICRQLKMLNQVLRLRYIFSCMRNRLLFGLTQYRNCIDTAIKYTVRIW